MIPKGRNTMKINFDQLRNEIWPMGAPTARDGEPQLYDYALGGLDLVVTELERKVELAHRRSELLLDIALHADDYDFTG
jgi:hypothetical protein